MWNYFKEVQPPKKAKKMSEEELEARRTYDKTFRKRKFQNRTWISSAGNVCILLTKTPSDVQCSPSIWQLLHGLHRALSVIVHNFLSCVCGTVCCVVMPTFKI